MNWRMGVGVPLQALCAVSLLLSNESAWMTLYALLQCASALVALVGLAIVFAGEQGVGARFVTAGSVLFIPLGLLAIFGALRMADEQRETEFLKGVES